MYSICALWHNKYVSMQKVAGNLPPGLVFMTFHFKEAATNLLTLDVLDPVSKIPELKVCVVKIQKL